MHTNKNKTVLAIYIYREFKNRPGAQPIVDHEKEKDRNSRRGSSDDDWCVSPGAPLPRPERLVCPL